MGKEFKKKKSTSEIIMQKEPKNKQVFFFSVNSLSGDILFCKECC